jgi:hypothetical protein
MKLVREENLGERSVLGKELVPDVDPDHAKAINRVFLHGVHFCIAPPVRVRWRSASREDCKQKDLRGGLLLAEDVQRLHRPMYRCR